VAGVLFFTLSSFFFPSSFLNNKFVFNYDIAFVDCGGQGITCSASGTRAWTEGVEHHGFLQTGFFSFSFFFIFIFTCKQLIHSITCLFISSKKKNF